MEDEFSFLTLLKQHRELDEIFFCHQEALLLGEHHQGQIDLLLTDVVMPRMDGPSLIKEVRATHPDMKVIFISGYTEDTFRKRLGDEADVADQDRADEAPGGHGREDTAVRGVDPQRVGLLLAVAAREGLLVERDRLLAAGRPEAGARGARGGEPPGGGGGPRASRTSSAVLPK